MNIKKTIWTSLIFVVIASVFNMLSFWLIDDYTTSFYISIGFANGSILIFALASLLMAQRGRYIYLSIQNSFIIGSYSIIATILNLCFVLFKMNNVKANVIVNVIILAGYLIFLFAIFAANAHTVAQLEHDRKERNAYYDLKDKAESLLNISSDWALNKKIESMYDKICSCQINRSIDVMDIDAEIMSELTEISIELNSLENKETILRRIIKVNILIDDRNKRIMNYLKR